MARYLCLATALGLVAASLMACSAGNTAHCDAIEGIVEPTTGHTLDPASAVFVHHPPTSGRHVHDPPSIGVHATTIQEARQVAALERGWVLMQYGPNATTNDRRTLRAFAGTKVVVAPAVRIDGKRAIAFTAWQHRQLCDHASSRDAAHFVGRFAGKPVF